MALAVTALDTTEAMSGAFPDALTTSTTPNDLQDAFDLQLLVRVLLVIFGFIGIVMNGSCLMIIYWYSSVRAKLGNIYLVHQCIVDLIGSVVLFVTYMILIFVKTFYGSLGQFVCQFFISEGPVWFVFNTSTHNLVVLNVERYSKIVNTSSHDVLFSRRRNYIILATIWVLNGVYKLPANIVTTRAIDGVCYYQAFWPSEELHAAFGISTFFLFCFLPLLVFVICYSRILLLVRKQARTVASHSTTTTTTGPGQAANNPASSDKFSQGQMKLLKTILLVCVGFFVCWTPTHVHYLCYNLGVPLSFSDSLYYFTVLMSVANCFINPFIYLAKFKDFRAALLNTISCSR